MSHQTLAYRRDIDGLRTIAVTSVVAYHAFPNILPGGFIGVDIFFVISGFLITGILVREHERFGRIDLADFYARRVRRLLPALLFMLIPTLVLSCILLPASGELQALAKSSLAALFFASNIFFSLQTSGYFATAPEAYPLLHTWTLAVEEQFYIVWPLLVPLMAWIANLANQPRRHALGMLFGMVFIFSLTLCIFATSWRPSFAFYLTPFRSWEFAIGAILSLIIKGDRAQPLPGGTILSLVGLILIGCSLWFLGPKTPFPGWIALLPTLGAAALLAAGATAIRNPVTRLLSVRPLVYVGQLSYGWYLWHWPLLALLRSHGLGQASPTSIVLAVIGSFLLSAISFHFVEKPIRARSWPPFHSTRASLTTGAAMLLTGAVTVAGVLTLANYRFETSPHLRSIADARSTDDLRPGYPVSCNNYQTNFQKLTPYEQCLLGQRDAKRLVIVAGDSHGFHLEPMLDRWGKERDVAILPRAVGGCRPFWGDRPPYDPSLSVADAAKCRGFNKAIFTEIRTLALTGRLIGVVVGARWPANGGQFAAPEQDGTDVSRQTSWIGNLIALAKTKEFRLVLTRDTPFFPFDVPSCLGRRPSESCDISREAADAAHASANRALTRLIASEPVVRAIDPSAAICDDRYCHPESGNVVLFKDQHHLSIAGSQALEPYLRHDLDRAILLP